MADFDLADPIGMSLCQSYAPAFFPSPVFEQNTVYQVKFIPHQQK